MMCCLGGSHQKEALGGGLVGVRRLGKGAAGAVWLVHLDNGEAAVKTTDGSAPLWVLEMSRKEAAILASLPRHPGLVAPLQARVTGTGFQLLLEYCTGGTLEAYCRGRRRLTENDARCCFRQLLAALQHLHAYGVAHRDLKLSNVLLAERPRKGTPPRLVLCDLGTAKVTQNMDRCETFVGTPGFMSPQVLASMLNVASGGTPTVPAAHQLVHPGGQLQRMGSEERGSRKAHGSRPGFASHLAAAASESDEGSGSGSRSSDMRGSGGGHTYNAAKADAWALGALLHALLRRGELPYGYSSFASLLPPQEALLTLFELENRHSWEAAAGERGAAQVRGALSSDARHLLSGLLHPDEAQRLSLEEVAEHPWVTAPLPSSHAAVLADVEARAATIAAAARPGAPDADAARTLTAAVVDAMFALLEAAPAFMRQHLRDAPGAGPGGAVLSVPLTGAQPGTPPSAAALCDALDALRSAADAAGVVLPCLAPPASHSASPFAAAAAAAGGGCVAAKVAPLCMPGGPGSRLHDCTAHVCDDTCYGLKCYR